MFLTKFLCCCERDSKNDSTDKTSEPPAWLGYSSLENEELFLYSGEPEPYQSKPIDNSSIILNLEEENEKLKKVIENHLSKIEELEKHVCFINTECQVDKTCDHEDCNVTQYYTQKNKLLSEITELKSELENYYERIERLKTKLEKQNIIITKKDEEIKTKEGIIAVSKFEYERLQNKYKKIEENNKVIGLQIKDYEERLIGLDYEYEELAYKNKRLSQKSEKKDRNIKELKEKITGLEDDNYFAMNKYKELMKEFEDLRITNERRR